MSRMVELIRQCLNEDTILTIQSKIHVRMDRIEAVVALSAMWLNVEKLVGFSTSRLVSSSCIQKILVYKKSRSHGSPERTIDSGQATSPDCIPVIPGMQSATSPVSRPYTMLVISEESSPMVGKKTVRPCSSRRFCTVCDPSAYPPFFLRITF